MNQFQPRSFNVLPPVVKNILIINGLLFLTLISFGDKLGIDLNDILGLHWIQASKFAFYQPITYMFMHANFEHILFNMFAVWMFGNTIERLWGGKRFLIYYLFTGLCAAALHYVIVYYTNIQPFNAAIDLFLANPDTDTLAAFFEQYKININPNTQLSTYFESSKESLYAVLNNNFSTSQLETTYSFMELYKQHYLNASLVVGASGSLFGILLAFGMMFPNAELFLIFIPIPIKAKYFVAGYGAIELILGLVNNPNDNVAHFAHLGGFIGGYILIWFWRKFDRNFRLL